MSIYKEKIQRQLRKALETFKNGQTRSKKTHHIHKQSKLKRVFRLQKGFYQEACRPNNGVGNHILNFFNILTVNERALRSDNHSQSYLQTYFYYKNIRKIEVKDNYIVLFLNDLDYSPQPVQDVLSRFRLDQNPAVRDIGLKLTHLSQQLHLNTVGIDNNICLTSETFEMLDTLGQLPFICKIFSEKLIISKSLLKIKEFSIQEFVVQSLKCKFPVFELLSSKNYESLLKKQIQFYEGLMEVLQGGIPFASFSQLAHFSFIDSVTSKNNVTHLCQISMSMPIPLVQLIKIETIIQSNQEFSEPHRELQNQSFIPFLYKIRQKEHKVLKNLISLKDNFLPQLSHRVASYLELRPHKTEDDQKISVKSQLEKSSQTLPYQ